MTKITQSEREFYQFHIDQGYGAISLGSGIGVIIGGDDPPHGMDPGWGFVSAKGATPELIHELCDKVKSARKLTGAGR